MENRVVFEKGEYGPATVGSYYFDDLQSNIKTQ
jgi:hypothetical protein